MTDKEQLEEIKELVKKIESILCDEWQQQELTNLIESFYYDGRIHWLINLVEELEKQNKHYREYLELIKTIGTYGKDISTGEIIRSNEANLAEEALEGEE